MSLQYITGYRAAQEVILNQGSTLALLQGLQQCTAHPGTVELFTGAVSCVKASYQALKASGVKAQSINPEIDAFLALPDAVMSATLTMNMAQRNEIGGQQVAALALAVDAYKGRISFDAPKFNNEGAAQPEQPPMRVEIVSMPTRTTTSEIERDAKGNIDYAVQTERDAV